MKEVRLSNEGLKNGPAGLKALFVGATAGIGASAVKQFALHAQAPTVYLVGRSQSKASPLLTELKSLNPEATFTFIEAEVSLLKDVDKVCDEILAKEQKLDLLWLSQGQLSFAGQQSEFRSQDCLLLEPVANSNPNRDNRGYSSPSCSSILLTDAFHFQIAASSIKGFVTTCSKHSRRRQRNSNCYERP
jgi:NAD(P)-dependent dehydrogenase (short-subunit alcohol dehydrogenase family)